MRFCASLAKVIVPFVLLVVVVPLSRANSVPVRGSSKYGGNIGFSACMADIQDFKNGGTPVNCEGFVPGVFTIDGKSYKGDLFDYLEPDGTGSGVLDVLELNGNSSLALNLVDPGAPTGVLMCGSFGVDGTVAVDSVGPTPMPGLFCTPGSSSSLTSFNGTQDVPNVQANFSSNGVTFINGSSDGITAFTEDGNIKGGSFAVSTPEPGSLILLGVGLLALGRKFRHA